MPITTLLFDFSRVLLFPKNEAYSGGLNNLATSSKVDETQKMFVLNEELLSFLKPLHTTHTLVIFTTGTVQELPWIRFRIESIFHRIYSVVHIGLHKNDSASYLYIAKDLGKIPSEIFFTDDTHEN